MKLSIKRSIQRIHSAFYEFELGIKNLIKWVPVIWKDRDWNEEHALNIFLFKVKSMYQYSKTSDCNNEELETLRELIEVLEKVKNGFENYENPAIENHNKKWGEPDFYIENVEGKPGVNLLRDRNLERYTKEQQKEKFHEYLINLKIAQMKRNRDLKLAMDLFFEYLKTKFHGKDI